MDIIELLTNDHNEVDELFRRFQIADKPETHDEVGRKIIHDLSVHAALEEQFVYPLVRAKVDNGSAAANDAIGEHAEVKRLLADLEKLQAGSWKSPDEWSSEYSDKMQQVITSVRSHVEEEEGVVFPELRAATREDLRKAIGALARSAKGLVPTHPHPLVPGTATAQLIAGPWVAVLDKVRDVLKV